MDIRHTAHKRPRTAFRVAGWIAAGIGIALLFALLFAVVVRLLWNWLMPGLFGLPAIGYLQALALVVLAKILFGGFGSHHGRYGRERAHGWLSRNHRSTGELPDGIGADREEFDRYWDGEGRAAFQRYLERRGVEKG